ncbi:vancomycin resistance protein YoaR [Thermasporomyces composti]|uniref:Vancomycin resistance protein YoaR n=1 Tax=Thermasporomyces composti TaxID=696763 RepID=A0A3D9V9B8_THECX|nr:vancomycin resistance protein YoaR [Thermasporomyces composti]
MYQSGDPTQPIPAVRDRRTGRIVAAAAGAVMLVLLGAYVLTAYSLGNRVPRGTTVAGVPVGGLSPEAAEARLRRDLLPRADKPLTLTAAGATFSVRPEEAGLSLDVAATVESAQAPRSFNPVTMVRTIVGGEEVDPVVVVDERRLQKTLQSVASKVDKDAVEGAITFENGEPRITKPKPGRELDREAAADRIEAEFLRSDRPIALPVRQVRPAVSTEDLRQALGEFAEPAMSAPVTVRVDDESFEATPEEIGSALSMRVENGELAPKLDARSLAKALSDRLAEVEVEPRDASIVMSGGRPTVRPSRPGRTVPPEGLAKAVLGALQKSGDERVAVVETVTKQPKLTTEKLEGLGVKEVVGEFTTYYPHAEYRNVNIGRAAELINGTLVLPGETFSFNKTVGERTRENGFTDGLVIKGGRLREELGGGVSQVATTTYNAAFFAGMDDVEHRPHGFYIDRYPVGREATVYWGSLDLRWRNNTPYAVYVQAWRERSSPGTRGSVTVRLWSTKYWEVRTRTSDRYNVRPPKRYYDPKPGCVAQSGVPGFEVDVYRWLYRNGKRVRSEVDHVVYKPEDTIICSAPPSPGS